MTTPPSLSFASTKHFIMKLSDWMHTSKWSQVKCYMKVEEWLDGALAWRILKPYKDLNHNIWFNRCKNTHCNIKTIIVDRMGVLSTLAWGYPRSFVGATCLRGSFMGLDRRDFLMIILKRCSWTLVMLESINTFCAASMGRGEIASGSNIPTSNACQVES